MHRYRWGWVRKRFPDNTCPLDECPYDPENDVDIDYLCADFDNCNYNPNTTMLGTCVKNLGIKVNPDDPVDSIICESDSDCTSLGYSLCLMSQDDWNINDVGDACECYADLDGDNQVGLFDNIILRNEYGTSDCDPADPEKCCKADMDEDGQVGLFDLIILSNQYGRVDCPVRTPPCTFP